MSEIRIGIIGTGSLADLHMNAYRKNPDATIAAVCDINRERAEHKAAQYDAEHVFDDYQKMLDSDTIDAVSIITWNNTHAPITIAALQAGKHVLCEKPPALNAKEAMRMRETEKIMNKRLMFGFVRRFEQRAVFLKEWIDKGQLGQIYYIKTGVLRRFGNPGGWFVKKELSGGGPLIDLGVHLVDLAMFFMGEAKPVSVVANTFYKPGNLSHIHTNTSHKAADQTAVNSETEDMATGLIRMDNDAAIYVETAWTAHIKQDVSYMDIFADQGGATLEPKLELYGVEGKYPMDVTPGLKSGTFDFDGAFGAQIDHFVDCIANDKPCICPAWHGVRLMSVLDAMYESAEKKKEVRICT